MITHPRRESLTIFIIKGEYISLTLSIANIEKSYFILKQLAKWGKFLGRIEKIQCLYIQLDWLFYTKMIDDMFLSLEAILDGKLP
jgi:nicotinamide riboside transporter PnuC